MFGDDKKYLNMAKSVEVYEKGTHNGWRKKGAGKRYEFVFTGKDSMGKTFKSKVIVRMPTGVTEISSQDAVVECSSGIETLIGAVESTAIATSGADSSASDEVWNRKKQWAIDRKKEMEVKEKVKKLSIARVDLSAASDPTDVCKSKSDLLKAIIIGYDKAYLGRATKIEYSDKGTHNLRSRSAREMLHIGSKEAKTKGERYKIIFGDNEAVVKIRLPKGASLEKDVQDISSSANILESNVEVEELIKIIKKSLPEEGVADFDTRAAFFIKKAETLKELSLKEERLEQYKKIFPKVKEIPSSVKNALNTKAEKNLLKNISELTAVDIKRVLGNILISKSKQADFEYAVTRSYQQHTFYFTNDDGEKFSCIIKIDITKGSSGRESGAIMPDFILDWIPAKKEPKPTLEDVVKAMDAKMLLSLPGEESESQARKGQLIARVAALEPTANTTEATPVRSRKKHARSDGGEGATSRSVDKFPLPEGGLTHRFLWNCRYASMEGRVVTLYDAKGNKTVTGNKISAHNIDAVVAQQELHVDLQSRINSVCEKARIARPKYYTECKTEQELLLFIVSTISKSKAVEKSSGSKGGGELKFSFSSTDGTTISIVIPKTMDLRVTGGSVDDLLKIAGPALGRDGTEISTYWTDKQQEITATKAREGASLKRSAISSGSGKARWEEDVKGTIPGQSPARAVARAHGEPARSGVDRRK